MPRPPLSFGRQILVQAVRALVCQKIQISPKTNSPSFVNDLSDSHREVKNAHIKSGEGTQNGISGNDASSK
jgi:hypothetical protein